MSGVQNLNAPTSRADQIRAAFRKYDAEHPEVWGMFELFGLKAVSVGRHIWGAGLIWERMRWEKLIVRKEDDFKLNNNFRPHYVRKFIKKYPEHAELFRIRKLTSEEAPPILLPELKPADFPDINASPEDHIATQRDLGYDGPDPCDEEDPEWDS